MDALAGLHVATRRRTRRAAAAPSTRLVTFTALALALAGCPAAPTPDAGPDVVRDVPDLGDYNVPAGFTLTPFLTTEPVRMFDAPPPTVIEPGKDYEAVLDTDAGHIVIDLFETEAPVTVNSFVFLARNHFFDLLQFHRVLEGFIAQGGDPTTATEDRSRWGTGGPGYTFGLEIAPSLHFDAIGVVGMAHGPDAGSNGSQFFIMLAPAPPAPADAGTCGNPVDPPRTVLDGCQTVFGRVVDGFDALPSFAFGQPPALPTRMLRVFVVERPR